MILCFSGTGNSLYAARIIAAATGDELVSLNEVMRHGGPAVFTSERPWVVAAPTHGWRLPASVEALLRRAKLTGPGRMYFFLTCGSEAGNAARYCRALCRDIGMEYMGLGYAVMPENYLAMFPTPDEAEAERIIARAEPVIEAAAEKIAAGKPLEDPKAGALDKFKSGPVNRVFRAAFIKDRKFRVLDSCIGCGKCARLCPVNDITLRDGRPQWHGRCIHCMACIGACPVEAIEYGRASVGRPRYYLGRSYSERKSQT